LARFGIVGPTTLREQWRFAIVGIAVLAAAITPSIDPLTMLLTMVPLLILYGVSILLASLGQRQFSKTVALDEEL
jgi:sec-independent protein translocase protein TatC